MKRGLFLDKRAEATEDRDPLFIVLTYIIGDILFVSGIVAFIYSSSSGALVYSQSYAKEIALVLDKAEPQTDIYLDFTKGYEVAEKNNLQENIQLVRINKDKNEVIVQLALRGGYSYKFFTDYNIDIGFSKITNQVILHVKT